MLTLFYVFSGPSFPGWESVPQTTMWLCIWSNTQRTLRSIFTTWWDKHKQRPASLTRLSNSISKYSQHLFVFKHKHLTWTLWKLMSWIATLLHWSNVLNFFNMSLIILQELPESGKPEDPVMDVLTFLQRPVERIQTYQALLKVSIQFYFIYFLQTLIINVSLIVVMPDIYWYIFACFFIL